MNIIRKGAALLGACVILSAANAATIYDNSQTDLNLRFEPGLLEIGDEITFAGTERYLSGFSFEYWGTAAAQTFAGNVEAKVRFYINNGAPFNGYATPGTQFYDSDWFSVGPTPDGRATLNFTAGSDNIPAQGIYLPNSMTFSVQFQGMDAGDNIGVDIFGPVAVGSSHNDYWQRDGTTWSLLTNSEGPINFAMVFDASPVPVPEPSVAALLLAAGMLVFGRFRSK